MPYLAFRFDEPDYDGVPDGFRGSVDIVMNSDPDLTDCSSCWTSVGYGSTVLTIGREGLTWQPMVLLADPYSVRLLCQSCAPCEGDDAVTWVEPVARWCGPPPVGVAPF